MLSPPPSVMPSEVNELPALDQLFTTLISQDTILENWLWNASQKLGALAQEVTMPIRNLKQRLEASRRINERVHVPEEVVNSIRLTLNARFAIRRYYDGHLNLNFKGNHDAPIRIFQQIYHALTNSILHKTDDILQNSSTFPITKAIQPGLIAKLYSQEYIGLTDDEAAIWDFFSTTRRHRVIICSTWMEYQKGYTSLLDASALTSRHVAQMLHAAGRLGSSLENLLSVILGTSDVNSIEHEIVHDAHLRELFLYPSWKTLCLFRKLQTPLNGVHTGFGDFMCTSAGRIKRLPPSEASRLVEPLHALYLVCLPDPTGTWEFSGTHPSSPVYELQKDPSSLRLILLCQVWRDIFNSVDLDVFRPLREVSGILDDQMFSKIEPYLDGSVDLVALQREKPELLAQILLFYNPWACGMLLYPQSDIRFPTILCIAALMCSVHLATMGSATTWSTVLDTVCLFSLTLELIHYLFHGRPTKGAIAILSILIVCIAV